MRTGNPSKGHAQKPCKMPPISMCIVRAALLLNPCAQQLEGLVCCPPPPPPLAGRGAFLWPTSHVPRSLASEHPISAFYMRQSPVLCGPGMVTTRAAAWLCAMLACCCLGGPRQWQARGEVLPLQPFTRLDICLPFSIRISPSSPGQGPAYAMELTGAADLAASVAHQV